MVGKVQHLLDPLEMGRQVTTVAAPLGMRLVAARGQVVVARRRWRRCRAESQGQLPGVDALGALAEAGPTQVVDDLLQRRNARLGRGERSPQLGYVVGGITTTAAAGMVLRHARIVSDLPASDQAKAAWCGITLP
jgi:hypothetical protein